MIASQTIKDIAPTLAVIAVVVGAAWTILAENHESRIEFQKEIGEVRVEIRKEIGGLRVEIREENAKTRDELRKEINELRKEISELRAEFHKNMGELRGDIEKLDSKLDEFKDSHEREHDLFYGQGDSENPTPPN